MTQTPEGEAHSALHNADIGMHRAIAYLLRHAGRLGAQPTTHQLRFLQLLGLDPSIADSILTLADRLGVQKKTGLGHFELGSCPVGWRPSVLGPVFYGYEDASEATGAPGPLRVYYPSLDGAVDGAPFLEHCRRYPLVLFLHGHCDEAEHYKKWFLLPAQLARSGYVVVVPALPDIAVGIHPANEDHPDLKLAQTVLSWMRDDWQHSLHLMPPPATAIVGHSFGALLGGRIATTMPVAAYASLSGVWQDWPGPLPRPLPSFSVPSLFTWGGLVEDTQAVLGETAWNIIPPPKHRVVFAGAHHWDYLRPIGSDCALTVGDCSLVGAVAADMVTIFLSKYLMPEAAGPLLNFILEDLVLPAIELGFEQQYFAGGHLSGLSLLPLNAACTVTHAWEAGGFAGSITLPA
jgi:hypothetical protein